MKKNIGPVWEYINTTYNYLLESIKYTRMKMTTKLKIGGIGGQDNEAITSFHSYVTEGTRPVDERSLRYSL